LAPLLLCLAGAIQAGGEKTSAYKPILSEEAYQELTHRSQERIGKLAKGDEAALKDLRGEALILAGYTLSTQKYLNQRHPVQVSAVRLAQEAAKSDTADAARKRAAKIAAGKFDDLSAVRVVSLRMVIGDIKDVMMPFANQAKGGEGVHPDLHYSAKVKNQNGSEALINALAAKKLTDANVAKMSKELELLSYRVAVIGSITIERGPGEKKKGEEKLWDEQAIVMRDAAIELAEAARKKDAAAIVEACKRLENSCVECHASFK
jgi:hypothetical protein